MWCGRASPRLLSLPLPPLLLPPPFAGLRYVGSDVRRVWKLFKRHTSSTSTSSITSATSTTRALLVLVILVLVLLVLQVLLPLQLLRVAYRNVHLQQKGKVNGFMKMQ